MRQAGTGDGNGKQNHMTAETTNTRILFVDDEPNVLEGLRNILRRRRKGWDMHFVTSGREAREKLDEAPFDVLVTDMRMPDIDGATLLRQVQEKHPGVARIILSGHAEQELALRAIPVAHQFLAKPCEPAAFENVVARAVNVQSLMTNDAVRGIVGRLQRLPSSPHTYWELMGAMRNENTTSHDVAHILKQNMSMCAKLLQIVNSAFYRRSRRITDVEEAVTYLGFNTVRQLTLAAEVFARYSGANLGEMSLTRLEEHAQHVAQLSSRFFRAQAEREDAYVAGLLHDIGKVVLATEFREETQAVVESMRSEGVSMHVAERREYGVTHADIGGYLLGLWGLPYAVAEAVLCHHEPERVEQTQLDTLAAVHAANRLMNRHSEPVVSDGEAQPEAADALAPYLEQFGLAHRLPEWDELAARVLSSE